MEPRRMVDKIWESHTVATLDNGEDLLFVDRHLLHEVSSPQAFRKLRARGLTVRRPDLTIAVSDHIVSTAPGRGDDSVPGGRQMLELFRANTAEHEIRHFDIDDERQGIVHVTMPETGEITPGMVAVCGDSHTCTLGALGALAWGIGTSEVEHVLASQTIAQRRPQSLLVHLAGELAGHASPKDVALTVVRELGVDGGAGFALEYGGPGITTIGAEGRFTLCNLSIETGAKVGMVGPDEVTFGYLADRVRLNGREWDAAVEAWSALRTDPGAEHDHRADIDLSAVAPLVSWGVRPSETAPAAGGVPDSAERARVDPEHFERALAYMGLAPGQRFADIPVDVVFIGSCTNSRISDLRAAARLVEGKRVAPSVRALVVPGSQRVRRQAEREGLDKLFTGAGFEWRVSGCSMCVSINGDQVPRGQRCVSTSNRNFEGRQGPGARTHLASPAVAAASAIAGAIVDPSEVF